jgi:hypothetical protein
VSISYALQLNAAIPALTLSTSNVAFGNVDENTTATQQVTLTSSGTVPLIVSAGSVSGTGFSMSGLSFPFTLNPNQGATLSLQFTPTTAGAMAGTVTLTSNASTGATSLIALSGTGEAQNYQVELTWNPITNSTDPVAGYNVYRSTSGGTYVRVNSSVDTQASWSDTTVQAGMTYSYEITSVDTSGMESVPSSPISVGIP